MHYLRQAETAWLRFDCKVADKSLVWWGHIYSGYVWPPSNFFNFIVETFESSIHKFREKVEIKTKKSASSEIITKQHQIEGIRFEQTQGNICSPLSVDSDFQ